MISEDLLAHEFTRVIQEYYPEVGKLLHRCYVRVITTYWGKPPQRLRYIGIYCPQELIISVNTNKDILQEVADNMGLEQVVCINARRLLQDPKSKLKQVDPRFWLELQWIAG